LSTHQGYEQAVKVRAIPKSTVTNPQHVAVPITRPRLVISYMIVNSIVDHMAQCHYVIRNRRAAEQLQGSPRDRDFSIRCQELPSFCVGELSPPTSLETSDFGTSDLVRSTKRHRSVGRRFGLEEQYVVSILGLLIHRRRCGQVGSKRCDLLMSACFGDWQPSPHIGCGRQFRQVAP